jgi:oligoribonuclease (3'-5' exoribonuclease)
MPPLDEAAPIAFVDCETTGLDRALDEIWEFAGVRVDPEGFESELHLFVEHDQTRCKALPEPFLTDHKNRWPPSDQGASRLEAAALISQFLMNEGGPQVHIAGNTVDFDAWMIRKLLGSAGEYVSMEPPWSYHLIDIPSMVRGYLLHRAQTMEHGTSQLDRDHAARMRSAVTPPYSSEVLSSLIGGVEPPGEGERHTAMGDARWTRALYFRMENG